MKNFTVIETLRGGRAWQSPADTAQAALDRFRDGRASFDHYILPPSQAMVSVTVVDPETGRVFTEEQLDAHMEALVAGRPAAALHAENHPASIDVVAQALGARHDATPPASIREEFEIDIAALEAEIAADADQDGDPTPNYSVTVVKTISFVIDVAVGDRSEAGAAALEILAQSENPEEDFTIRAMNTDIMAVTSI